MFFIKMIRNMPDSYDKAMVLIEKNKDYIKALEYLNKYLKFNKDSAETFFSIGYCHYMLGRNEKALYYFRKSLEIGYDYPETFELMAKSQVEIGQNHLKPVELIKRARMLIDEMDKEVWEVIEKIHLESKAWIYFKIGKTKEALSLYESILPIWREYFKRKKNEFEECYSPLHYHFAMIYKFKGEIERAKSEFKKSMKAGGPQSIFAKKSKEELEKSERIE